MSTNTNKTIKKLNGTKSGQTSNGGKARLSKETLETQKAAKKASSTALRISKALELPVQFIEKGKLIEVRGTESRKTIKSIQSIDSKMSLKKGDKIWLKPKG